MEVELADRMVHLMAATLRHAVGEDTYQCLATEPTPSQDGHYAFMAAQTDNGDIPKATQLESHPSSMEHISPLVSKTFILCSFTDLNSLLLK